MRRTLYTGILLGALWAVLAGCATGGDESKPDDAISLYLSAYMEGRYEEAYQYLSAEDRQAKSLEAYVAERKDSGAFLTRNLHRLIRHDIREVTLIDDNTRPGKGGDQHPRLPCHRRRDLRRPAKRPTTLKAPLRTFPSSAATWGPSNRNTRPRESREGRSRRTLNSSRKAGNGKSGPAGGSRGPRGADDHDVDS